MSVASSVATNRKQHQQQFGCCFFYCILRPSSTSARTALPGTLQLLALLLAARALLLRLSFVFLTLYLLLYFELLYSCGHGPELLACCRYRVVADAKAATWQVANAFVLWRVQQQRLDICAYQIWREVIKIKEIHFFV